MSQREPKTLDEAKKIISAQDRKIERLEAELARLRKLIEELRRAGKRQAAPFAKGEPKAAPKRPGRKSGAKHGPSSFRKRPERVDRVLRAELPCQCPECSGNVEFDRLESQYQWDIPKIQPIVTEFEVEVGHCLHCGQRVQGRHPEQTSDALGNARCQVGPNAVALATHLNKEIGAPFAKIAAFFVVAFGLRVATSTLVRALLRLGRKVEPAYDVIRQEVQRSTVVYPDETGWRVGGRKAWLWVFVGVDVTLYVIARYRGFSVARWALGPSYAGLLGHDGWSVYDRFLDAEHQTCLAHLLRRCQALLDIATRRAVSFPRELQSIILDAIALRDSYRAGETDAVGLLDGLTHLELRLERLLDMDLTHPGNVRLAKHVRKHRDELFTFLEHPDLLEATNWPAEQAIRPAVIARKISGCNRSWDGARSHGVIVSILRTARQRDADPLDFLVDALRQRGPTLQQLPAFLGGPAPPTSVSALN